jgi:hypothetical protein
MDSVLESVKAGDCSASLHAKTTQTGAQQQFVTCTDAGAAHYSPEVEYACP